MVLQPVVMQNIRKLTINLAHSYLIRWVLLSLCAPTIGLYEISEEKIGNVEKSEFPIEVADHSQCIFT